MDTISKEKKRHTDSLTARQCIPHIQKAWRRKLQGNILNCFIRWTTLKPAGNSKGRQGIQADYINPPSSGNQADTRPPCIATHLMPTEIHTTEKALKSYRENSIPQHGNNVSMRDLPNSIHWNRGGVPTYQGETQPKCAKLVSQMLRSKGHSSSPNS